MNENKRLSAATALQNELTALESKREATAQQLQTSVVDALRAGNVPDNSAVDDCHRFLGDLRKIVETATSLGLAVEQPLRLENIRGMLGKIADDEQWLANRSRYKQEASYILRLAHRAETPPAFLVQLQADAQKCLDDMEQRTSATADEIRAFEGTTQVYRDIAAALNDPSTLDDETAEATFRRLSESCGFGMIAAIQRKRVYVKTDPNASPEATKKASAAPASNAKGAPPMVPAGSVTPSKLGNTPMSAETSKIEKPALRPLFSEDKPVNGLTKSPPQPPKDGLPGVKCPSCQEVRAVKSKVRPWNIPLWLLGFQPIRCLQCGTRFWKWSPGHQPSAPSVNS